MQKRRSERMRQDEVLIRFGNDVQAEINKQILRDEKIKFRVSAPGRIFLPSVAIRAFLKKKYGTFPVIVAVVAKEGSSLFNDILVGGDDYHVDENGIQMINSKEENKNAN